VFTDSVPWALRYRARVKLLALFAVTFAVATPAKTIQLAIVHTVRGCHIWQTATHSLGPTDVVKLARGGHIKLRVNCPMDFRLVQVRGPHVALGDPTFHTGTTRTIAFPKRGTYVFSATNLQSSEQMGLQTLGPDSTLRLTVSVS
jgi:hypothetical protein